MYQSMLVRLNRSALATFSAIFALALAGGGLLLAPSMALAAHTATVTVDKTFVQTGTATYGFSVSNTGTDPITWIQITAPALFTINDSVICPTNWNLDAIQSNTTKVVCTSPFDGDSELYISPINSGGSGAISFSVTSSATEGVYSWSVKTRDSASASQTNLVTTTVDNTPPTTTNSAIDLAWHQGSVSVTLTPTDGTGVGVASTKYCVGAVDCSPTTDGTSVTVSSDGENYVRYFSTDTLGNTEEVKTAGPIKIDNTKPVTIPSISSPKHGTNPTYIKSSTLVSLSATDDSGSGVGSTHYSIDSGAPVTYSAPFTISGEGSAGLHSIAFGSVDAIGNIETPQTVSVFVDDAAPDVGTVSISHLVAGFISGTSNISATVNDGGGSGVANCEYTLNGNDWISISGGTCSISGVNTSTATSINIRATDNVGNVGNGTATAVTPDTTAPVTTDSGTDTSWHQANVTVTLTPADVAGSGVASTKYCVDSTNSCTPTTDYTSDITISTEGTNYVRYQSVDFVGNTEGVKSATNTVKIDKTAPTGTITINSGATHTNNLNVTLTISGTDNLSGVTEMDIANSSSYDGWEAYATSKAWILATTDGEKTVRVKFKDLAGNETAVGIPDTIILDRVPPTVILTQNHSGLTVRDADTVVITATFNEAMISAPTVSINAVTDDVTAVAMTPTGDPKVWTYPWDVPAGNDGTAVVTVAGSDLASNVYAGATNLTFTIDNIAPTVVVTSLQEGGVAIGNLTIDTSGVSGASVCAYKFDSGTEQTIGCDATSISIASLEGNHTLTFYGRDNAGNEASDSISFVANNDQKLTVGASGADFTSIQTAINNATGGDIIEVVGGIYTENVNVNKSLILIGVGNPTVTAANPAVSVFNVTSNNVNISGFTVTGANVSTTAGIYLGAGVTGSNIHDNNLTGNGDGIWLGSGSNHNTFTSNTVSSNTWQGFEIYHSDYNTFTSNTANSNTNYGFKMESADHNTFTGNTANSNGKYGFYFSAGSSNSDNNTLTNNIANSNTEYGIRINSGDGNSLTGNTFNLNVIAGIRLKDTITNLTLDSNSFTNSQTGIDIATGATGIASWTGTKNSIYGNTTNVSNGGTGTLNATKNWWGTAVLATVQSKITGGAVTVEPYYINVGKTILSDVAVSTVYVDDDFTEIVNGGHIFGYNAFNTIQEGIDAVANSGTVNVEAGTTYSENLTINEEVTLQGAGRDVVTLTGSHTITADNVVIDGFRLQGISSSNVITVNDATAISGGTISNNYITGGYDGIRLGFNSSGLGVDGITIRDNIITGNAQRGIRFYDAGDYASQHISNITISDNEITSNSKGGISTYGPGPNTITNNTVNNNTGNGISIKYDDGDIVTGNIVTGNAAMGINMHQVTNSTVENNTVSGQVSTDVVTTFWGGSITAGKGSAIYIHEVSTGNTVRLNDLKDNKIGVLISKESNNSGPSNNSINKNKITGNSEYGILNALVSPSAPTDATKNWWNATDSTTIAAKISGAVDYRPWCTNGSCSPIDTTSPTVTVDTLLTNDTTPVITGTVVESNAVTVTITVNSQNYVAVVTSGTWSANVTDVLAAGTHSVTATAEDLAGNIGTDATSGELQIDLTVPTVSLTKDHADTIVRDADTVVVTATFNEAMASSPTITINAVADDVTGVAMTNTSGNVWTYSWNVPSGNDGSAVVTIAGSDTAGNAYAGTDNLTFTIDNAAPAVAITQPTVNSRVNATKVITFTDGESTTPQCSIDNSVWVTCTSGTTTLGNVTGFGALTDGNVTLYLRDTDVAGNIGTASVALVKDTSAPMVDSHTPSTNAVNVETDTITIIFNEAVNVSGGQITLSPAAAFTIGGSGTDNITLTTSPLSSNTIYTVTVTTNVKDLAGNALALALAYSWSFTTATLYNVELNVDNGGWNLVSLPIVPVNTGISTVLGSASSTINSVWTYDPTNVNANTNNGGWFVYYPNNAELSSSLSTMTAGYGYWISVTADTAINGSGSLLTTGPTTPPSRTLASGWNLVGYYQIPGEVSSVMGDAFNSIGLAGTDYTALFGFNNSSGAPTDNISTILPGEAFWIAVSPAGGKNYTPSNL